MCAGVGKSGSPAPNPMTSRPAAFIALAFASTARVADSAMLPMRVDRRARGSVAGAGVMPRIVPRCEAGANLVAEYFAGDRPGPSGSRRLARPNAAVGTAKGSSSIGQSPGLQNRWLGVRVPPALPAHQPVVPRVTPRPQREETE